MPSSADKIAAHLGWDVVDVRANRYQPSRWTSPVFSVGEGYWCAGRKPADPTNRLDAMEWEKVISSYDKKTVLWFSKS